MKITDVRVMAYTYPLPEPYGNAIRWNRARSAVIVFVSTDEGIEGVGEADCAGGPPSVTAAIVENELKPKVIGKDPLNVERIWKEMYSSTIIHGRRGAIVAGMSGIDIALWDIVGKSTGLPIYKLLGAARNEVEAYASGGFYREGKTVSDLVREAEGYAERGFKGMKMKVGRLPLEEDMKRVSAVRKALGSEFRIMVDANSAYSAKTAMRMARLLEEVNVEWFEEPVSPDDVSGSAKVAKSTFIPIAGYETHYTRYEFRDLVESGAVDIVQPDVIRSGGFTECRKIAALASSHNLPCAPHVFSSAISWVANLHLVAGVDNGILIECDQNPNVLRTELLAEPLEVGSSGYMALPEGPGLGIELNLDAVEEYRVY